MKTRSCAKSGAARMILAAAALVATAALLPVHTLWAGEPASAPAAPAGAFSSISGIVLDPATKKPLAGVPVTVRDPEGAALLPLPGNPNFNGRPVADTDAQGQYVLRFTTTSRRLLMLEVLVLSDKFMYVSGVVAVYSGESVTARALETTAFGTMRGRVVDPDGKPIAGAKVRSLAAMETVTDKDGYFTDARVPPYACGWDVMARGYQLRRFPYWIGDPFDHTQGRPEGTRTDDPDTGARVIKLTPCKAVTGKVVQADGKPVTDVRVYGGVQGSLNVLPNWSVPLEAQGAFTMDITSDQPKPPTTMEMHPAVTPDQPGGFYIFPVRGEEIAGESAWVKPGQTEVVLRLHATGIILVEVSDLQGKPIPKVRVRSMGKNADGSENYSTARWATTAENGQAALDVPAGPTRVQGMAWPAEGRGRDFLLPSADVIVQADHTARCALDQHLVPEKDRPPTVTGVLVDEEGKPVLHARVGATFKENLQKDYRGSDWTQVDGKFEVAMLLDTGERRMAMEAAEGDPPQAGKAGTVRVVAGLKGQPGNVLDITRDWPPGARTLDLGRVVMKRPNAAAVPAAPARGR